jgi:hypothetical protein
MATRSNVVRAALLAAVAAGLAVALMMLLFPTRGTSAAPAPGALYRLAADYDFSGEQSTEVSPGDGGEVIYDRVVAPPANANTLYVIFSGQGDQHSDAVTNLTCWVDGHQCGGDDWVQLQYYADNDYHDNGIHYTWCKAITPGKPYRHVQIGLASSNGGTVYVENMTYYVDAAFTPHGCTNIGGVEDDAAGHGG